MSVLSRDVSGDKINQYIVVVGTVVVSAVKVCAAQLLGVSLEELLGDRGTSGHSVAAEGVSTTATATTTLASSASQCLVAFLYPNQCGLGDALLLDRLVGVGNPGFKSKTVELSLL